MLVAVLPAFFCSKSVTEHIKMHGCAQDLESRGVHQKINMKTSYLRCFQPVLIRHPISNIFKKKGVVAMGGVYLVSY